MLSVISDIATAIFSLLSCDRLLPLPIAKSRGSAAGNDRAARSRSR